MAKTSNPNIHKPSQRCLFLLPNLEIGGVVPIALQWWGQGGRGGGGANLPRKAKFQPSREGEGSVVVGKKTPKVQKLPGFGVCPGRLLRLKKCMLVEHI